MSKLKKWWKTFRKEPWCEIIGEEEHPEHGWGLKLDWNKYFIADLSKAGVEADTEEEMIHIWFQAIKRARDIEAYEEDLLLQAEENQRNRNEEDL